MLWPFVLWRPLSFFQMREKRTSVDFWKLALIRYYSSATAQCLRADVPCGRSLRASCTLRCSRLAVGLTAFVHCSPPATFVGLRLAAPITVGVAIENKKPAAQNAADEATLVENFVIVILRKGAALGKTNLLLFPRCARLTLRCTTEKRSGAAVSSRDFLVRRGVWRSARRFLPSARTAA